MPPATSTIGRQDACRHFPSGISVGSRADGSLPVGGVFRHRRHVDLQYPALPWRDCVHFAPQRCRPCPATRAICGRNDALRHRPLLRHGRDRLPTARPQRTAVDAGWPWTRPWSGQSPSIRRSQPLHFGDVRHALDDGDGHRAPTASALRPNPLPLRLRIPSRRPLARNRRCRLRNDPPRPTHSLAGLAPPRHPRKPRKSLTARESLRRTESLVPHSLPPVFAHGGDDGLGGAAVRHSHPSPPHGRNHGLSHGRPKHGTRELLPKTPTTDRRLMVILQAGRWIARGAQSEVVTRAPAARP